METVSARGPWATSAAIAVGPDADLEIGPAEIEDLRSDEVLVRLAGSGICQTDLHVMRREYDVPFPLIPGHEGSGWVVARGTDVTTLRVGDPVILTFPSCGHCPACARGAAPYCESGFQLSFGGARADGMSAWSTGDGVAHGHFFQQSSFSTLTVATERNAIRVPRSARALPLDMLGPFGCSLQTGAGTVMNSLSVSAGDSIAVLGVGSVGLAAVMAAAAVRASTIAAVDINPERLALALDIGATHAIDPSKVDLVDELHSVAPGGLDHVVEVTGRPELLQSALAATRLAGQVAFVAGTPTGTSAPIDLNTLLNGRRLRGVIQGDADPSTFIPKLLDLHLEGRFPFDRLITRYPFADIQQAVDGLRSGSAIKPVVQMPTVPDTDQRRRR